MALGGARLRQTSSDRGGVRNVFRACTVLVVMPSVPASPTALAKTPAL
jgi:hypothetical protein